MNETSRRKFLAVAGAGAAGTVAVAASGSAAAAATPRANAAAEPVVVLIEEPGSSTLTIMFGDEEVVVRDRDLVVRILNAAGGQ